MGADERETIVSAEPGQIRVESFGILSANEVSNRIHAARQEGYRKAISDLRQIAADIDARGGNGVVVREAANELESRLTQATP